jgi:hypothetical protein
MDRHRKEQAGPVWAIRVMPPRMPINPGRKCIARRAVPRCGGCARAGAVASPVPGGTGSGLAPSFGRATGAAVLVIDGRCGGATGAAPVAPADLPVIADEHGKAWCERCDARVPTWFATDCISGSCSLRAAGFGGAARDGADL